MAASSLLALIDDIASLLDDVSVLTKVAAKKTTGVLGDDLALNAQQVTGVQADRELPVVLAVAKGSLKNKLILVPAALAISAFAPWAVTPLLMLGGAFLCYEGFEKLAHKFLHNQEDDETRHVERVEALADPKVDVLAFEQEKVKGAIRTDFILSAEIIAITLGAVANASFAVQVAVMAGVALLMTIGVYGVVAGIVKLDDAGLYLSRKEGRVQRSLGRAILRAAPYMMKSLSVLGTAAMFMVGGGILMHGIPAAHEFPEHLAQEAAAIPGIGGMLHALAPVLLNAVAGIVAGALVLAGVSIVGRVFRAVRAQS
ncbi:DUF808 domain-containing protein [Noviherbaspirillum massiliense]|uniref:DUF808 domain-containing protein n=1 Tax=Noviherbaspirillum massiliense TaxID=1465823 RepID=UPI000474AC1E|nr:DUF808 domain-containing protein [Noviherbaspirillum massiliense]